jgi:hypothetical protein
MRKIIFTFTLLLILGVNFTVSQVRDELPLIKPVIPFIDGIPSDGPPFVPNITKNPGYYSRADWQALIDAAWGEGLPTADKLAIFDNVWNTIDQKFACFHNHNINWDSMKTLYRPQVEAGCSRGRFDAIMNYMTLALKECHTRAMDRIVYYAPIVPGVPLLFIGGFYYGNFGAGLTMLPDSTLLVYEVVPNHPLGLEPGDIVMGYDGIPWKVLIFQMMSYQLPLTGSIGSSPSAYINNLMVGAGRNWHLFDVLDVKKYSTGQVVHLSTAPLLNQTLNPLFSEQMPIPGIQKPNVLDSIEVTYGVYPGTNIGYIYGLQWTNPSKVQLFNAVNNLLQLNPDGLIFDFRTNFGGNMFMGDSALNLLFPASVTYLDFARRSSTRKHTQMTPYNASSYYTIPGRSPGFLKPIAILTGPGAASSGDQVSLRLRYHPMARIFGKPTNGAFNGPTTVDLHPDWFFRYASADAYELNNPGVYLTHTELRVDEPVWLTPSMVAQGRDDVVEAALNWINAQNVPAVTVFEDNAENGFGNWTTNQSWNTTNQYSYSPVNSFTDSPSGNYINKADNSMTLKNSLNVSAYNQLTLSFWHRYNTQATKDFCRVEVSSNGGTSWVQITSYSGNLNTMTKVEADVTNYKSSNFKIRFRLISDRSTVADGWYVDDIKITGKTSGTQITNITGNNNLPGNYSLLQNYPNPFNPVTTIKFDLPTDNFVTLKIYDMLGREVATLVDNKLSAGTHSLNWNASQFSSGIYFYRLTAGDFKDVKRMILIK